MRDYIFLIGPSGVGKSTLAKGLFAHYGGALAEMSAVPEFTIPEEVDPGLFEERVCWECCTLQLKKFRELGVHPVISADFDDLRTADIPETFRGSDYITLKLICTDREEHRQRMLNRGEGLIDLELLEHMADKIAARPNLPGEITIDTAGKKAETVLAEAIRLIDTVEIDRSAAYIRPLREQFYSWVLSNGLR